MVRKNLCKALVVALCGAFAMVACFALAGCGSSSSSSSSTDSTSYKLVTSGELTIGSDLDYKPMEYLNGSTPEGFDVAMMQNICKRLGLKCNYLPPQNFDTLLTQVAAGTKMDVACSSLTITDEREQTVDFSTPYFDSNQAVVVLKKSSYKKASDLNGIAVGAQSGTSGEDWVKENLEKSSYTPYTTTSDGLAALRTGAIKGLVFDESCAENLVSNEYKDCKILQIIPTGEQYGIAVSKSNTALKTAIDKALSDMQADGTITKLKKQWITGNGK
jgi:polar amino acid transport system substrate-binding protein